jgi:hypothetical protein
MIWLTLTTDSVSLQGKVFSYLCIPASETTLHQKRMSIADQSHIQPTATTNPASWIVQLQGMHRLLLFYRV